jgi:hypothetical protein
MRAAPVMPPLKSLRLFDSCLTLGTGVHSRYPEWVTAGNVLAMMDRYEIAEALVHDNHARLMYPREHGNQRLLEAVRGRSRLHPVWVIEPPKSPGRGPAKALVEEMLDAGVRAARLPMKIAPPMPWLWDDLCAVLEEHRVPCFLDFGGATTTGSVSDSDVNGVREIALAHPHLPMVLSNVFGGLGVHYAVVPLIRRLPNLHLDITGILEFWRAVAADPGPERVLFATAAPFIDPGILISNVQYEYKLSEQAKRLVGGDNLRRLLGGVR